MAQSTILEYPPDPHFSWFRLLFRMLMWLISWLIGIVLLLALMGQQYEQAYEGKIVEGVTVNGIALGGLTPAQASLLLDESMPVASDRKIVLKMGQERWMASATELGIQVDGTAIAQEAFEKGRTGLLSEQWLERLALWQGQPATIEPRYTQNETAMDTLLTKIANQVTRDPQDAILTVQGLSVSGTPAIKGQQLDVVASREKIIDALEKGEDEVELVVVERLPHVIGAEKAAQDAQELLSQPLVLYFEQPDYHLVDKKYELRKERRQWIVPPARLADMLQLFSEPIDNNQYAFGVRLQPQQLRTELAELAALIAREPRDARFDYNPTSNTLTPMVISQDGLSLDVEKTLADIEQAIKEGQYEVELAVDLIPPRVATSDQEKMNITGLAVSGFSDYTGSSDEREVNISIAANRYHGVVIPPNSVFSFNEYLGWVVDANGYEEGYIISGNRTEVDVGGGVCQVSTTLFRSAFYAGFQIVERQAHGYRVPYYENGSPLGFDATVFSPVVDFKFRNDTDNYYIMGVINDREANTLQIDFYGQPTGRTVELVSETIKDIPHDEPIYEDDPTLPVGTVEQVDWAHPGATIVLRRVIEDSVTGEELGRDEFWSEYRPWQARFLVGTRESK